jgi:hypothetical protein
MKVSKIWGFHDGDYEECRLLGRGAVQILCKPTFFRNVGLHNICMVPHSRRRHSSIEDNFTNEHSILSHVNNNNNNNIIFTNSHKKNPTKQDSVNGTLVVPYIEGYWSTIYPEVTERTHSIGEETGVPTAMWWRSTLCGMLTKSRTRNENQ